MVVPPTGEGQTLVAHCVTVKQLGQLVDRNLVIYDDATDKFRLLMNLPLSERRHPGGQPRLFSEGGRTYYLFPTPYATLRVAADLEAIKNPAAYEAFTCLNPGGRFDRVKSSDLPLDQTADGRGAVCELPGALRIHFRTRRRATLPADSGGRHCCLSTASSFHRSRK